MLLHYSYSISLSFSIQWSLGGACDPGGEVVVILDQGIIAPPFHQVAMPLSFHCYCNFRQIAARQIFSVTENNLEALRYIHGPLDCPVIKCKITQPSQTLSDLRSLPVAPTLAIKPFKDCRTVLQSEAGSFARDRGGKKQSNFRDARKYQVKSVLFFVTFGVS